jgi:hypothetical protein
MSQWHTGSRISKVLRDLQGFVYLQAQVVIGPENQGGLRDGRGSTAMAVKGIGSSEPRLQLWLPERDCSSRVVLGNHPISVRLCLVALLNSMQMSATLVQSTCISR